MCQKLGAKKRRGLRNLIDPEFIKLAEEANLPRRQRLNGTFMDKRTQSLWQVYQGVNQ